MITKKFNLTGMDLSAEYNSDSLWYLQDATVVGQQLIKRRPTLLATPLTYAGAHRACGSSRGKAASWCYDDSNPFSIKYWLNVVDPYDASVSAAGGMVWDSVGGSDLNKIDVLPASATRLEDDVFFVNRYGDEGAFLTRWSGSETGNTQSGAVTASVTNASNVVTLSTAYAIEPGTFINFTDTRNHFYRVDEQLTTTTVQLSQPVDFTDASTTFTLNNWSFVTTNTVLDNASAVGARALKAGGASYATEAIWQTSSGGEPVGMVYAWAAEAHAGRLFISNGNEIRYSGTSEDVTTRHSGYNYWDADSIFTVAPEMGHRVEAMVSTQDGLIIFKDIGICVLRGVVANGDPTRLGARVDVISTSLECASVDHVCSTPAGVVLTTRHGIFLVTADSVSPIGKEVFPIVAETIVGTTSDIGASFPTFLMDNKLYIYIGEREVVVDDTYIRKYAVWDLMNGSWQCRTFNASVAPSCAVVVPSSDGVTNVAFPSAAQYGTAALCYRGNEAVGVYGVASNSYDRPEFICITSPMTGGDDHPNHVRVRHVWTNATVSDEDDTTIRVFNNLGDDYDFDPLDVSSETSAATYPLASSNQSWTRNPIASDLYGWSKGVGIIQNWDGSGNSQDISLRALAIEYDESAVTP